jgi:nucleoid-associated protein YgaU
VPDTAAVIDTSPLILLSRISRLDLFLTLRRRLVVPVPVLEEIRAKGDQDPTVRAVEQANFLDPHTVMQHETLRTIAEKYYGDREKWGEIFKANKDKIKEPDHLVPGLKLNIPIIGP